MAGRPLVLAVHLPSEDISRGDAAAASSGTSRACHVGERHRLAQRIDQHGQIGLQDRTFQADAAFVEADFIDIQHPGRRLAAVGQGEDPIGAAIGQALQVGGRFRQLIR